jgi:hypothetical protein
LKTGVDVPAGATPDEAAAITQAIETILKRRPERRAGEISARTRWAAAALREALDDRV